jgi:predicted DNA-binding transcriptional regulator AlpA
MSKTYLDEDQLCAKFHIAKRTAQRWRKNGSGPPWIRFGERRVIYPEDEADTWADERKYRHRADELSRQVVA